MGNLRTALLAWAWARSTKRDFYLRLEDLDRGRARDPQGQLDDLRAIGIDWDDPVVIQSERTGLYEAALQQLRDQGLVFECFCSRKDIREAASAAHAPPSAYPGPCASLDEGERKVRRTALAARGARPALRLKPDVREWTVHDELHGDHTGAVESVVLRRGDGEFAYNLAAVVDDCLMGIDQVVRGDDLLASSPTQAYVSQALYGSQPTYVHVPLVVGPTGARLAKRDGAVTMADLRRSGLTDADIVAELVRSTGVPEASTASELVANFDATQVSRQRCTFSEPLHLTTS